MATRRRPAFSKRDSIWPMTFLATASGLMMERVRSTAIRHLTPSVHIRMNGRNRCNIPGRGTRTGGLYASGVKYDTVAAAPGAALSPGQDEQGCCTDGE